MPSQSATNSTTTVNFRIRQILRTCLPALAIAAASLLHPISAFSSPSEAWRQTPSLAPPPESATAPAPPSLATWLEQSGAGLGSRIGADDNGLRGLRVDRAQPHEHICQIPRGCILVADAAHSKEHASPIDALAATLLGEIELGSQSRYLPYLGHMPPQDDVSLASIGGNWNDEQLARLGHAPTIQYFTQLRAQRTRFVRGSAGGERGRRATAAGWAYDLVSSRALQGPFGRGGTVRAATLATLSSSAWAAAVPLLGVADGAPAHDLLLPSQALTTLLVVAVAPLLLSAALLAATLLQRGPELAMLPWIDVANHEGRSRLRLEYGLVSDKVILKRDGAASSPAGAAAPSGFVTFDYGGASGAGNNKLLGLYGFVEEDNPNDTLVLPVRDVRVRLGRHGALRSPSRDGGARDDAREAARALRGELLALDRVRHDGGAATTDPVEAQRCALAARWRREKVRLLDEFLSPGVRS